MSRHLPPDVRSAEILATAVKLAKKEGFRKLTRAGIAQTAKVSTGLVSRYFGSMDKMKDEVMKVAVRERILPIVADGLADRHKVAVRAPEDLKRQAAESLHA